MQEQGGGDDAVGPFASFPAAGTVLRSGWGCGRQRSALFSMCNPFLSEKHLPPSFGRGCLPLPSAPPASGVLPLFPHTHAPFSASFASFPPPDRAPALALQQGRQKPLHRREGSRRCLYIYKKKPLSLLLLAVPAMDLARIWHLAGIFCLTCLLIKALQLHRRRQELLKALSCFPGPPTHWLYGNIFELLPFSGVLKKVESWSQLYPCAFPIWYGRFSACIIVTHPDYAKALLARTDPKDSMTYRNIIPWIGKGLLVSHGTKWSKHRKLLTPGFHYNILKPYVALMAESTKVMLDKWEELIKQENSVELFEHVSLMTLDSIMKCAFSCNTNCQMDRENAYIQAVFELCSLAFSRMHSILGQSDLAYWFTPQARRFRKACQVAHCHTDKIIKERKESLGDEEELQKIQQKRHLDFLDILLCAKDENHVGLSDEDIRAEVDTFMFEGHDTTASGVSWLFYCLAQNPEHQQKCREEIKSILGDHDTIHWDDLSKMTYCTLCIKESLRIYPSVPGISRELSKPITFFDGRTLPEGSWVGISINIIQKDPNIWKDPKVFDPQRFSPENISHRNSHAFLPFSAGPRNCIGQQFAMNEMKVALAMTLLRFELLPDSSKPPPIPVPQIIMRSENGIHLSLKKLA